MKLGLRSRTSPGPAGRRSSARGWPRSSAPRTMPASAPSGSWTTSSSSRGSAQPKLDMLEAYTTLGFIAAHTSRARLGTMVTGVTYRHPAILVKQVTALDVLSGGRAWMGIGAAWFEREHLGLGVPFPPLSERFERLEEAIQIALQMWSDDNGPYRGKHYQLAETLNSPQALTKPHPPILIGGSGEKKTLKLVARYADACNLFGDLPTVRHKLDVLRRHCEAEGRNYDDIEKTVLISFDLGPDGSAAGQLVQRLGAFAEAGVQTVIGGFARRAPEAHRDHGPRRHSSGRIPVAAPRASVHLLAHKGHRSYNAQRRQEPRRGTWPERAAVVPDALLPCFAMPVSWTSASRSMVKDLKAVNSRSSMTQSPLRRIGAPR